MAHSRRVLVLGEQPDGLPLLLWRVDWLAGRARVLVGELFRSQRQLLVVTERSGRS